MPTPYDESSVAPKERINIKYRPATGDTSRDIELPLSLLVLANLQGGSDERPLEQRPCISINPQNFNAVMKEANLQLAFNVHQPHATDETRELPIHLQLASLEDFTPDRIAQQVPELHRLLQLREALVALKGPLGNMPAFRQRLQALIHNPEARQRLLHELSLLAPDA
ncbi:MAG: type VI secretion system contractile sheath small subunit [Aeromonadaceae bacterium]|nr:type VI secretion system contractile sheath small subunit [Aeromonadaceae bacterium]